MRTISDCIKNSGWKESQFEEFWMECSLDFIYFVEHVLGYDVADYHKEWFKSAETYKRLCIMSFRGSGKTAFFAAYFIWKGIFNKKKEFLIVSKSLGQSKDVLRQVREMFMDNEILKQFIPERDTWSAFEIKVTTGSRYVCKPYNVNVRGIHPDWVLMDEAGEYDDKSIFWNVISPTVDLKLGRTIVIGTPKSHLDLLMELFYENTEYFSKIYPIMADNKPLWPQKYTMDEHDFFDKKSIPQIRREKSELTFQQEYMCSPVSTANQVFPSDMIQKCKDSSGKFLPYAHPDRFYYIGCDLAFSKEDRADYSVFTVIEVEKNKDTKRVVQIKRLKGIDPSQQREIITKLNSEFRPRKIIIDKTGVGETFLMELKKDLNIPVEGFQFTRDEKGRIVLNLRHEFEKQNIIIPSNKEDQETYNLTEALLLELSEFVVKIKIGGIMPSYGSAGKHDDCVMSLALATEACLSQPNGNISLGFI